MKTITAVGIALVLLLSLAACGKSNDLVGTWEGKNTGTEFIFNDDKTCIITGNGTIRSTYSMDEKNKTIYIYNGIGIGSSDPSLKYTYNLNGDELTLTSQTDHRSMTFTRKKTT